MTLKNGYKEKTPNWPKFLLRLQLPQRKLRHARANWRLVFRRKDKVAISANSFRIKKQTNKKTTHTPITNQQPTPLKPNKKKPHKTNQKNPKNEKKNPPNNPTSNTRLSALGHSRVDEALEFRTSISPLLLRKVCHSQSGRMEGSTLASYCQTGHFQCGMAKVFIKSSWLKSVSSVWPHSFSFCWIWPDAMTMDAIRKKQTEISKATGVLQMSGPFNIISGQKSDNKNKCTVPEYPVVCFLTTVLLNSRFKKWGLLEFWAAADLVFACRSCSLMCLMVSVSLRTFFIFILLLETLKIWRTCVTDGCSTNLCWKSPWVHR